MLECRDRVETLDIVLLQVVLKYLKKRSGKEDPVHVARPSDDLSVIFTLPSEQQ
jgi:hypothetical protein